MTRLIDGDLLLKRVNEVTMVGSYLRTWLNVIINEQPTVKVKPIEVPKPARHGKWIPWKYHNGFRCEFCNEPVDNKHNYCPNCGAYMRGEDG